MKLCTEAAIVRGSASGLGLALVPTCSLAGTPAHRAHRANGANRAHRAHRDPSMRPEVHEKNDAFTPSGPRTLSPCLVLDL